MSKIQGKAPRRSPWKISKSFWIRKKKEREKVRERYQNLPEEEKECNKNLSEEQKQKQVEYLRNYYFAHKK